jgi:hypothetical protein
MVSRTHKSADFEKKCCNSITEISPLPSASYSEKVFCKFLASASEIVHFFLFLLEVVAAVFPFAAATLLGGIFAQQVCRMLLEERGTELRAALCALVNHNWVCKSALKNMAEECLHLPSVDSGVNRTEVRASCDDDAFQVACA